MGDDLKAAIEALTKNVALMQKNIEANASSPRVAGPWLRSS
jgi:hypothetical protein